MRPATLPALCAAQLLSAATVRADVLQPTTADPNPYAVYRAEAVAPFFAAARLRRVDLAVIGDSNIRFGGISGHEDGMARGFAEQLGCYATRVDPLGAAGAWAAPAFDSSTYTSGYATDGAPPSIRESLGALPVAGGFPGSYVYLAPGSPVAWTNNSGIGIGAQHPIGISGTLRWHFTYSHWPAAAGGPLGFVSPTVRAQWPGSAAEVYATGFLYTSGSGVPGRRDFSLDVPAGPRSEHGVLCCLTDYAGQSGARGPFVAQWTRVENLATQAGMAYSPLLYQGGRTARDAAISLLDRVDQPRMAEWFRQVTRLQNGEPMLLVQIIHGGNDANTTTPAVVYQRGMATPPPGDPWPAGAPSNSAAGMRQNFQSIINRLRDFWVGAGYDEDQLYFLVGGYFPQPPYWNETSPGAGDGQQWTITQHEGAQAWRELCRDNARVAMVDGYKLSTPDEFTANLWYANVAHPGGDQAHLAVAGYRAWGRAYAQAVTRACVCGPSIDYDLDGRRTINDLFVFLTDWFAGAPLANFDGVGDAPVIQDLFAFLEAWFAGCAGH